MFEIFEGYQVNLSTLREIGFKEEEKGLIYSCLILDGEFEMRLFIKEGRVTFDLVDTTFGDLYPQVHMEKITGEFIGQVRAACLEVLYDLRKKAYKKEETHTPQARMLLDYVEQTYGHTLDYPWEKGSNSGADTGIFRHSEDLKWYGVLMKIDWQKLDASKTGQVQVLNCKNDQVALLLTQKGIYPAFHMNKKYWVSLPLDGSLSDDQICQLVTRSFDLTKKKRKGKA